MLQLFVAGVFLIGPSLASSLSARIDEDGLSLFTAIGKTVAENAIRNWHVDYRISGHHVRDCDWRTVQLPKANTSISNGMLNVSTEGGLITTRCHVVIKVPLGKIAGDVELLLGGLNTAISLRANNKTGEAEIASCQAVLGALDVQRVHGGIAIHVIKQLFAGKLGKAFRRAFNDRACKVTADKINMVNSWLFPVTKDRQKIFTVEYKALKIKPAEKALAATADIAFHYGKNQTCKAEFKQEMVISNLKMLSIGFSGPVVQCLFRASHESKSLWYRVNSTDPKVGDYLRTTCGSWELCIGRVFPGMQAKFPNKIVDITVFTSKSPEISINSGVIRIFADLAFNVTVNPTLLIQINCSVLLELQKPHIANNHFYVLPTFNIRNLTVVNSDVGYPGFVKRSLIAFGLTWALNIAGNKFWTNGFNLTDVRYGSWHLGDATEINLLKEYAIAGLDFSNSSLLSENWKHSKGHISYLFVFVTMILMLVFLLCVAIGRRLYHVMFKQEDTIPLIASEK